MTNTSFPCIDIIDTLLEGLEGPSLIVLRGSTGTGKAYIMSSIIKSWIDRNKGRASIILFMISDKLARTELMKHGINPYEYENIGLAKFFSVTGISSDPRERLSQLVSVISSAVEFAGNGIVAIYPGDLAFGGLSLYDLVNIIGLMTEAMNDHETKFITAFTLNNDERVRLARDFLEEVAQYVLEVTMEVPEAGPPRRYLTIIKPLRGIGIIPRTLEIIPTRESGVLLAHYGIMGDYDVEIDLSDKLFTGLEWFDRLTGGLVRGSSILVTGFTGTGKTLLLLSLAYNVAQLGEKVLYISLEEPPRQLIEAAKGIGYDIYGVLDKMNIVNINPRSITLTTLFSEVVKHINDFSIIVLDGLHALWKEFGTRYHRFLRDITYYMKMNKRTLLMSKIISRREPAYTWLSSIVDGIIELRMKRVNMHYQRILCLKKMRLHPVTPRCYRYSIGAGIELLDQL